MPGDAAGAYAKERRGRRWRRRGACGEVAVRWRGGAVAQAACGGGLGCVSAAWREVGRRANMGWVGGVEEDANETKPIKATALVRVIAEQLTATVARSGRAQLARRERENKRPGTRPS